MQNKIFKYYKIDIKNKSRISEKVSNETKILNVFFTFNLSLSLFNCVFKGT